MRILISSNTYYPQTNGQAIFVINLAERLAARGHAVTVLYPSHRREAYRDVHNGVTLEHCLSLHLPFIHEDVWIRRPSRHDITRLFERAQPEVVHIQDHYPPAGGVEWVARKSGAAVVCTNHFMPENIAPYSPLLRNIEPVFKWLAWRWVLNIYNRADMVSTQSKAAAALIKAAGLKPPVTPISCGIDLKRFHPDPAVRREECRIRHGIDPRKKVFLFVGRVDPEKKVDVLLRAVKMLRRDDIQLAVAGQGKAAHEWQAMAKHMGLGSRVVFTGFIPNEDLPALLNSVDVFTMPSEAELLSIASLEAMACGKPMLLANAVALPELVTPGENGYLFRPGDPADVAQCMERMAGEQDRWAAMGQASVRRAQEHSLDKTVEKYERMYEEAVRGRLAAKDSTVRA